ncbi:MAG: histidinol-phosphate transaminase [Gemmatimonadaceae bacterium]
MTRQSLKDVPTYDADSAPARFQLADNTNAFGSPPSLPRALADARSDVGTAYPSTYSADLRELLAEYVGVRPEQVVVGCGSTDLIDCALRAICEPNARVAFMYPTFVMVRPLIQCNALDPVAVPLGADFSLNVDALLKEQPDLVYLCSPNNPTGTTIPSQDVERVLDGWRGPVLLDEAYAEYAGTSLASRAPDYGRVVVLRTLSKAWGLAGFRVGYAVGARSLIRPMEQVRGPFRLSSLSERIAAAVLRSDRTWMEATVEQTREMRERMVGALNARGIFPPSSKANFLLVPVADAVAAAADLRRKGVAVRPFPGVPGVGDALRVTIGPWEAMQRIIETLTESHVASKGH